MNHLQIAGLALIVAAILLVTGSYIGSWIRHQTQRAELRALKHEWNQNVVPKITQASAVWLPKDAYYQPDPWAASEAYYNEFPNRALRQPTLVLELEPTEEKTVPPEYDSELDTRIYMARQDEDMKAFLRGLRER